MDIKYIKVGKWYNVPFKVVAIKSGDIHIENGGINAVCQPSELSEITARQDVQSEHSTVGTLSYPERVWNELCDGLFGEASLRYAADDLQAMQNHIKSMNPDTANGTNNTETAPKYDPNREFKKGDKVRVVERHGRYQPNIPCDELWKGLCTVAEDEDFCNNLVKVRSEDGREKLSHWWYLELVTPVEELEPYYVKNIIKGYAVCKMGAGDLDASCVFWSKYHPNARAAAEAERDRLNAEWRKEQSND